MQDKLEDFKEKIEALEEKFFKDIGNIRQDINYQFDAGLCDGQIRAIKLVKKLIKEIFDEPTAPTRKDQTSAGTSAII